MRSSPWKGWPLLAAGIVLAWCVVPAPGAEQSGAAGVTGAAGNAQVIAQPGPGTVQVQVMADPGQPGDYWLGVQCAPVGEPLRAQFGLDEGQGLVVQGVLPDSPAAKAGLKQYDVLAAVDGQPIKGLADLIAAVEKAKDKEDLTLEVIRGGKRQELKARPAKRPADLRPQGAVPLGQLIAPPEIEGAEGLRQWFEKVIPEGQPGEPLGPRFRIFGGPAVVLPPGARVHPPLPGDLSVSVTRQGDQPARIVVKRGDEKWEITEDELDKLPADIRPHVEHMLGRAPRVDLRAFGPEGRGLRPLPLPQPPGAEELERRLEQMGRQLEELRESLRELRRREGRRQGQPLREAPAPDPDAPKDEA